MKEDFYLLTQTLNLDFFLILKKLQLRLNAEKFQELLSERAIQFRAIERRLLARFKDKTPAPLQHLDTLLEGTYRQVSTVWL